MVGLAVVDPTGHTNHIQGTLSDQDIIQKASLYDQRCPAVCGDEMEMVHPVWSDIDGVMDGDKAEILNVIAVIAIVFAVVMMRSLWMCIDRKRQANMKNVEYNMNITRSKDKKRTKNPTGGKKIQRTNSEHGV